MKLAELNLMEQYRPLIPKQPVPLYTVIEQLTEKLHATEIEHGEIPGLKMHLFNAVHLPRNEELQLTQDQLEIKAIKIPITRQTEAYVKRDFVPISSDTGEENYIYLAYETQVGYCYSNSNRLFLETKLMRGIEQKELEQRTEDGLDFLFYLKTYDELYCGTGSTH